MLIMPDTSLLAAALVGYEAQLADINERIAAIKKQLGTASADGAGVLRKRSMSAAARKRIAAAQRARWKAYRKAHKGR